MGISTTAPTRDRRKEDHSGSDTAGSGKDLLQEFEPVPQIMRVKELPFVEITQLMILTPVILPSW